MFSKKTTIMMLTQRRNLLMAKDAVTNANIIHKIDRKLRKLGA